MSNPFANHEPGSPEEEAIVGSFVRQRADRALRDRYASQLANQHGIVRPQAAPVVRRLTPRRLWRLGAAAAVALLLLAGLWTLNAPSEYDRMLTAQLDLTDYQLPYARTAGPQDNTTVSALETQLMIDFGAERYEEIVARANGNFSPVGTLFLGLAHLELGRYAEAQTLLLSVPTDHPLATEATWYAALIDLKLEDFPRAKARLNSIPETQLEYYRKAQRLLSLVE